MNNDTIDILFLNRAMIEGLPVQPSEILDAVSAGVEAQGRGDTIVEPTVFVRPRQDGSGLATIRGAVPSRNLVGIKNVGSFPDNHLQGLPGDVGLMTLFAADTGLPVAILDGSPITTIRTAAMTALGAKHLAKSDSRILGHIGARGISPWNIRFLDSLFDLDEVRIHSARSESREASAEALDRERRARVVAVSSWEDCLDDADIIVDGSSLRKSEPLFPTGMIRPGATVVAYGGFSSLPLNAIDILDKVVMDRWQDHVPGGNGVLAPHMEAGLFSRANLHALLCDVVSGEVPGRESNTERILFWHRGMGPCDITLANLYLEKAKEAGAGITLPYL